mmetsp:Transcript_87265/g.267089  ORF Transcript_87265/g.267089 Transcript_87265/m.267089 type:complete len:208 (+) Transcript_87265:2394-3017(+)
MKPARKISALSRPCKSALVVSTIFRTVTAPARETMSWPDSSAQSTWPWMALVTWDNSCWICLACNAAGASACHGKESLADGAAKSRGGGICRGSVASGGPAGRAERAGPCDLKAPRLSARSLDTCAPFLTSKSHVCPLSRTLCTTPGIHCRYESLQYSTRSPILKVSVLGASKFGTPPSRLRRPAAADAEPSATDIGLDPGCSGRGE